MSENKNSSERIMADETDSVRVSRVRLARLREWKGKYGSLTDLMNGAIDLKLAEIEKLEEYRKGLANGK
jgi:hypothetical protein